ncbi:MAG: hypothetical protein RL701_6111, partial [Pseudomonadota bacterium]
MRIRTQRVVLAAVLALPCSCAATTESTKSGDDANALAALHAQQIQQAARIEELEARLSLVEAEARRTRSDEAEPAPRAAETVRIGANREVVNTNAVTAAHANADEEQDAPRTRARPRLRLYGRQNGELQAALPAVPEVSETLPVAPLPSQRSIAQTRNVSHVATAAEPKLEAAGKSTTDDGSLANYLGGLRLVRERRYDDALAAFSAFIVDNPTQRMVPNAMYWRGEAHYAKREYAQARSQFEAVLAQYPQSEKAADALLKLALCFRQLGSEDQARGAFRRLRTEYPNSQAA